MGAGKGRGWIRVALIATLVCGAGAAGTAEAAPLAPSARITSGPSSPHASRTATFTFTSDDPTASFQCRLDGAAYAACSSPKTYGGLTQASHLFEVRAVDLLGNTTPSPAQWGFVLDGPDTTIDDGPDGSDSSRSATFSFTGAPGAVGCECALDGAAVRSCTSPATYSGVPAGSHTFRVRAVDDEGLVDSTPATRTWTNGPETTITDGPSGTVGTNSATFAFDGTPAPVDFECSLNATEWLPCTSPITYSTLWQGWNTFAVRAIDDEGLVDTTPATRGWNVQPQADQSVRLSATPQAVKANGRVTFTTELTNAGPAGDMATVRLDLPAGLSLESFTFPDGYCVRDERRVGCGLNEPLPPGSSTTLVVVATVDRGTRGPLTALAWVEQHTPDPDSSNDRASVTIRVGSK